MRLLIITCLIAMTSNAIAQEKATTKLLATKFIRYYNLEQADSLYMLFSEEVKKALPQTNVKGVLNQMKSALGTLSDFEYAGGDANRSSYVVRSSSPEKVLNLHFDRNDRLAGFRLGASKKPASRIGNDGEPIVVKSDKALLKGTLSVPKTNEKIPVILLIAGSGPTDRDGNSTLLEGKPNYFLKLSEALKGNNIAVLRYDKRGVGESTTSKTEKEITFDDMVADAAELIKCLKNDNRFSKVIVAGHSEGSLVGMLAAKMASAAAFISIAGTGQPADVILKSQFKELLTKGDYSTASSIIDSIRNGQLVQQKLPSGFEMVFRKSVQPYLRSWMKYDPTTELARLSVPVLIVQGDNDIQVGIKNGEQLKKSNPRAQLKILVGMNHVLVQAPQDRKLNLATYSNSNLGLHPELIPTLVDFIGKIQ